MVFGRSDFAVVKAGRSEKEPFSVCHETDASLIGAGHGFDVSFYGYRTNI